jgi:thiol-disulfide isomerase/thioredoxin
MTALLEFAAEAAPTRTDPTHALVIPLNIFQFKFSLETFNIHTKIKNERCNRPMSNSNATATTILKLVLSLLLLSLCASPAFAAKAPSFELPSDTGKFSLEQYRGQVVFVDFWASWCIPCRYSFPWLNEMHARYAEDGFKIIAINLDKDKAKANRFLKLIPANFETAYDPKGSVADLYSLKIMPTSYLIDPQGNLIHKHKGFKPSDGDPMEARIKKLLESSKTK